MSTDLSVADLEAAMAAAKAFVDAIGRGDEEAARALCYEPSLDQWDLSDGVVNLWRQGPTAHFYGQSSPSFTARVLDGIDDDDPSLACFGFVIANEDERWRPVVLMDGPRQAIAIAMIQAGPGVWRVWGSPPPDEWSSARLVDLPGPSIGPVQ